MTELQAQLSTSLEGRYTIEQELAGGGIARVFVAHETRLDRRVVIKVLSPELAAGLSAKRFEREIRLAASLQQANIVPLLEAGNSGELPLYIMPFVDGLSLRERLTRNGRLPLEQTISILRDVARALAYAHDRGVVHRDIKPENILLSGDAAVVTDFGIAKAISAATAGSERAPNVSTVTQPGTAVGTPTYMAPEQLTGDPSVDHRADIYSFGCLAYELLAGEPPFSGTLQSLFAAHLSHTPTPISEKYPECPPALATLVMRCLAKDPAARPQSARDLLSVLDGVITRATTFTQLRARLGRRQRITAGVLIAVVALGALFVARPWRSSGTAAFASIAVIPFVNMTGDSSDEYLADGIADEVATALGKVPRIRVVSRGLSYRYKGQRALNFSEVGRELNSDHLLHGSLRRTPDGLRVSAQLVRTTDNFEAWSETYDRSLSDAIAFQDSITRAIAGALGRQFASDTATAGETATRVTADAQAYDLYLRGRFLLQRRGSGVRQAVENFERAIARDSNFAQAHGALALALELLPYFEPIEARSLRDRAVAAAQRALTRDASLAEAYTALAMAHQHAFQWDSADAMYQRAVAIDSTEADAHIQYGRFLFYTGRFIDAQRQFDRARRLDPYSAVASGWVGYLLVLGGRQADGIAELRRALEIDSTSPPLLGISSTAFLFANRRAEAKLFAERLARAVPEWRHVAAANLGELGERERAEAMLREFAQTPPAIMPHTRRSILHLALDDTATTLDAMERATEAGEIWPTYYSLSEPRFDVLRRSARFAAIVRRAGLNVAVFTSPNGGRPR
ncbi:MAG: protein kinase [Gemmatimonadota bacterium]